MLMRVVNRLILALMISGGVWGVSAKNTNDPPVVITEDANTVTIDNGIVHATIKKANANLLSLRLHGLELLSQGQGYWNVYGRIPGQQNTQEQPGPSVTRVTQDPTQ